MGQRMYIRKMLLSAFTISIFAMPPAATVGAAFQDLLNAPAMKTDLAAKTILVDVTTTGKRIVAVGWRGDIVYSDDGGKTWVQATVPVSSDLVAVCFATQQKGWAVGHDGVVLHSKDGGVSWVKQFDGRAAASEMATYYKGTTDNTLMNAVDIFVKEGPDKPFLDVWFENEETGFIVGAFSMIFRTTDGGNHWIPWYERIDNPKRLHLYAIQPVGDDLFISAEQGTVFKLDRNTMRFAAIKLPYEGTLFGITGPPGVTIAFGMRGTVFRSSDGGADWQKVETSVSVGLTGGALAPNGEIILVSQLGEILRSDDKGMSFRQVAIESTLPAASVVVSDKDSIVLAGPLGVAARSIRQTTQ